MLITLKAVFLLVATVVVAGNDLGVAVVVHGILNRFVGRVHGLGCSDNLGCTGVFRLGSKGILSLPPCCSVDLRRRCHAIPRPTAQNKTMCLRQR